MSQVHSSYSKRFLNTDLSHWAGLSRRAYTEFRWELGVKCLKARAADRHFAIKWVYLEGCKIMFFVGILDEKIFERISGTNQFSEGFQSFWVIFYNKKNSWSYLFLSLKCRKDGSILNILRLLLSVQCSKQRQSTDKSLFGFHHPFKYLFSRGFPRGFPMPIWISVI